VRRRSRGRTQRQNLDFACPGSQKFEQFCESGGAVDQRDAAAGPGDVVEEEDPGFQGRFGEVGVLLALGWRADSGGIEKGRVGEGLVEGVLELSRALGDVVCCDFDTAIETVGGGAFAGETRGFSVALEASEAALGKPVRGAQEGSPCPASGLGETLAIFGGQGGGKKDSIETRTVTFRGLDHGDGAAKKQVVRNGVTHR
jgi:hypothetical protein